VLAASSCSRAVNGNERRWWKGQWGEIRGMANEKFYWCPLLSVSKSNRTRSRAARGVYLARGPQP